jgi:succinate-semialdehyde dehydrogenase/glutarate-semialdehyde dehydrogenase
MIIEGERATAASGETYQVKNPATGEVVDEVPSGGEQDVDRAAQAAEKAQKSWGRLSAAERARILHKAAAHMLEKVDEIAPILTAEQGKTLLESRIEARRFGENIAWFADLADECAFLFEPYRHELSLRPRPTGTGEGRLAGFRPP